MELRYMKLINELNFTLTINLILLTGWGFSQSFGWQENGVPVRQGAHIEWSRTGDVSDSGNMIFGWSDTRTGDRDVYAQKFDQIGNKLWGEDGLVVISYSGRQEDPIFISDDNGGVYVIWSDFRNEPISDGQPYAQHISSDGSLTWNDDGVPLSDDKLTEFSLNLCKDGNGGVFALWKQKNGGHYASYLNINNNGPTGEVEVISDAWSHSHPSLEMAGNGGAVMVWADERNDDKDIYGQRLGFDGIDVVLEWETIEDEDANGIDDFPKGGIPITTASGDQSSQKVTYYSEDYSVIVWQDERYNAAMPSIFATFLDSNGQPASFYSINGLPIVSNYDLNGDQQSQNSAHKKPRVKADSNGALVIWNDFRNDASGDIYIQKITHESNGVWNHESDLPFDGRAVAESLGEQSNSRLTIDGNNGVFITWEDKRGSDTDIYTQHLDSDGNPSFESDGLLVCGDVNDQLSPLVKSDGIAGAFVVWQDYRDGSIGIYVQHLDPNTGSTMNSNGIEMYFGIDGNGQLYNDSDPLQLTPKSLYLNDDRTLLFWEDRRFGNQNIDGLNISTTYGYGQIIDSNFDTQLSEVGSKISDNPIQMKPSVNSVESGLMYHFVGQDFSSGENILFNQLLNEDLTFQTDESNRVDATDWANQKDFIIGTDINGYYYTFYAKEYWAPSEIWLQIYDQSGNTLLPVPINIISNSDGNNYYPRLVFKNPEGGVILLFDQNGTDIRFASIDSNGQLVNEVVSIIANTDGQLFQDAVLTQEGIFITWKDLRNNNGDIFGQYIDFEGMILSGESNGFSICEEDNDQSGANTAFISTTNTVTTCWEDFRNGTHWDTYCRVIDLTSNYINNEVILSDAIGDQMNPYLFTSLDETILVVWEDFRNGANEYSDIYIQELVNNEMNYSDGGVVVCDAFHNQVNPRIDILSHSADDSSYLIYWDDMRSSGKEDLINVFSQSFRNDEGLELILGDVNFDGTLNILDVVNIVNYVMGTLNPTLNQEQAADYNEDGTINVLDIVQIVNAILNS